HTAPSRDHRRNVFIPAGEGACFRARVTCFVVNASNAAAAATDVIQNRFDDMRLDADLGHAGRRTSSQIVQYPGRNWLATVELGDVLVERNLVDAETAEHSAVMAEH